MTVMTESLRIDPEDLIYALQNRGGESEYFLDLQTGEVVFLFDEGISDPDEELEELIENGPDRFRSIDPVSSSDGWQIMAEFIEQMPEGEAVKRLVRAVHGDHPFRRFKDTLLDYPDIREQWFAFERRAMLEIARKWLEQEEISAELTLNSALRGV